METPDFTGLHGKELIKAHMAWQKHARKAGASFEKVRYAGLTQAQAVEMHQHYMSQGAYGSILIFSLNLIIFGWTTISGWLSGDVSPWYSIGQTITVGITLIGLTIIVYKVISVRNKEAALRS